MNNPIFPVRSQGGILQKMINNDNKRAIKNLPKSVTFRQVELIEEEKEYPEFARYLKKNIDPNRWLISPMIVKIKKEGNEKTVKRAAPFAVSPVESAISGRAPLVLNRASSAFVSDRRQRCPCTFQILGVFAFREGLTSIF